MKIRSGLVSNSSSSSFIIAVKGKLDKEAILTALGVPQTSPLYSFAENMADALMNAEEMTFQNLAEWGDDGTLRDLIKKGLTIYEGSASDDDYRSAEAALCDMTIHFDSEDLVIIKEGGY